MKPTSSKRLRSSALKFGTALIFLISIFIAGERHPFMRIDLPCGSICVLRTHFPNSRLAPAVLRRCYAAIRARSSRLRGGPPWLPVMCGKFHIISGSNTNAARHAELSVASPPDPRTASASRSSFCIAVKRSRSVTSEKVAMVAPLGSRDNDSAIMRPSGRWALRHLTPGSVVISLTLAAITSQVSSWPRRAAQKRAMSLWCGCEDSSSSVSRHSAEKCAL